MDLFVIFMYIINLLMCGTCIADALKYFDKRNYWRFGFNVAMALAFACVIIKYNFTV